MGCKPFDDGFSPPLPALEEEVLDRHRSADDDDDDRHHCDCIGPAANRVEDGVHTTFIRVSDSDIKNGSAMIFNELLQFYVIKTAVIL